MKNVGPMTESSASFTRIELVEMISTSVRDQLRAAGRGDLAKELNESSPLFGTGGLLDSLGLVTAILEVEQQVNDRAGTELTLADDRAMSQKNSPFRTIGRLADYVLERLQEKRAP